MNSLIGLQGENFSGDEDRYPGPGNAEDASNVNVIKDVPAEDSSNENKIDVPISIAQ